MSWMEVKSTDAWKLGGRHGVPLIASPTLRLSLLFLAGVDESLLYLLRSLFSLVCWLFFPRPTRKGNVNFCLINLSFFFSSIFQCLDLAQTSQRTIRKKHKYMRLICRTDGRQCLLLLLLLKLASRASLHYFFANYFWILSSPSSPRLSVSLNWRCLTILSNSRFLVFFSEI